MNSAISDVIFNYDSGEGPGSLETLKEVQVILSKLGHDFSLDQIKEEFNSRL